MGGPLLPSGGQQTQLTLCAVFYCHSRKRDVLFITIIIFGTALWYIFVLYDTLFLFMLEFSHPVSAVVIVTHLSSHTKTTVSFSFQRDYE